MKNFIAVHHLGVHADENLLKWFTESYAKHTSAKLDMGKSCIRFKKMDQVPVDLIGELAGKITVDAWISIYENRIKR